MRPSLRASAIALAALGAGSLVAVDLVNNEAAAGILLGICVAALLGAVVCVVVLARRQPLAA